MTSWFEDAVDEDTRLAALTRHLSTSAGGD